MALELLFCLPKEDYDTTTTFIQQIDLYPTSTNLGVKQVLIPTTHHGVNIPTPTSMDVA